MINIRKPHWLAAYTKPRNEKKVYERLVEAGVETFLPLVKNLKQWSDRKKWVEEPLLRSYVFVKISEKEYYTTLETPGLIRYVTFEGKAVPIPDRQIETLRILIGQKVEVEITQDTIELGQMVEIIVGTLAGVSGEMIRHKGKKKIVVRLNHISHTILLTLPKGHVVKIQN